MVMRKDVRQIRPYVYEIAQNFRHDMRVPARFYADETILQQALGDDCLDQLINTATLRVSRDDLLAFFRSTGHEPLIVDLPVPPDGQNG